MKENIEGRRVKRREEHEGTGKTHPGREPVGVPPKIRFMAVVVKNQGDGHNQSPRQRFLTRDCAGGRNSVLHQPIDDEKNPVSVKTAAAGRVI